MQINHGDMVKLAVDNGWTPTRCDGDEDDGHGGRRLTGWHTMYFTRGGRTVKATYGPNGFSGGGEGTEISFRLDEDQVVARLLSPEDTDTGKED